MLSRFITRVFLTAVAALLAAYLLNGIRINSFLTAVTVAFVLGLLNGFIKPILVFFTLPVTILTLGLFLLVINVLMVKWTDHLVDGFEVDSWFSALLFSFIVAVVTSVLEGLTGTNKKSK